MAISLWHSKLASYTRFGHKLHLAITNAIKHDPCVARALGMIRKLITHFLIDRIKEDI